MNEEQERFIDAILCNDEVSTDEELVAHFMQTLNISEDEAKAIVAKRDEKLNEFFKRSY